MAREIYRLAERDPSAFQEGAVRVLRSNANADATGLLVKLLHSSGQLFQVLKRRALARDEAVAVARMALSVDPNADIDLARRLATQASTMSSSAVIRMLEILERASDGKRLLPSLLRLRSASDPRVRSKIALMMARINGSVGWARKCLEDPDPRTRASAVEGLWGNVSASARDLLKTAARDRNNRVAANALYGLQGLGESWAIAELLRMGKSDVPLFRASAAWAMGETGDDRFVRVLERMAADPKEMVRKRALAARERIAKAERKPQEASG